MLILCYDGTRYRGWQKQGNTDNTLQQKMETLLTKLLQQETEIHASGRTDAGVHARMQVCSFRAETERSCGDLLKDIRAYLPEDIGAISLEDAPPRFHARLSCREKTYLYRIWQSNQPNVFERKYLYFLPGELDTDAMKKAADILTGRHDFSAFTTDRRVRTGKKEGEREIREIRFEQQRDAEGNPLYLNISYTGDGFLYNMARILTGTLLEVGKGRRSAESMTALLESRDREQAGPTVPAQGLTLWQVKY
ncbi:MAG: tRNA pseudouridine(38-40) synthase TruA [Clostridiales bacterium]|nr:tRNA pseudouridine(38-40) synthase TruA [Clostridiales bacterium]